MIEHGTLNLVAQLETIGNPVRGIIVPNLHQYRHLADASTETDNLPYHPALKPYDSDGKSNGTLDDRWAITNRNSFLDYQTAATLATASRTLSGFNNDLSARSLASDRKLPEEADEAMKNRTTIARNPMAMLSRGADLNTVLQLYITTREQKYTERLLEKIWSSLDQPAGRGGNAGWFAGRGLNTALIALPYMDDAHREKLRGYVLKYKDSLALTERTILTESRFPKAAGEVTAAS